MGFTHLHLHTEYSLLDGAVKFFSNFTGGSVVRAARHTHKLRSVGAWFGSSDSTLSCGRVPRIIFSNDYWGQKNNGVFDTHHFSWKCFEHGGLF